MQIAKRSYGSPENAPVESLIQYFLWREEFFYIDE